MKDNFILPNLFKSSSFKDLENIKEPNILFPIGVEKKEYEILGFQELFKVKNHSFIIGEPGCGKSRLFEEICRQAEGFSKKSHFISLKEIKKNDSIKSLLNINFIENIGNVIFCLDALDEVNPYLFSIIISKIKDFTEEFKDSTILVSCRMHYITKNIHFINKLNFNFILITPFSENQISEYLTKNIIDNKELVNKILKTTKDNSGKSILSIPRYLKEISNFLEAENFSENEIESLKRHNFLELAIYHKLESEILNKEVLNENDKYIVQRVLEKLALVMEIYQTNQLKIDELITFFDDVNSNLNLIFLKTIDIDNFIKRQLKITENTIEFDNTEFQEYLAAKELLRLGSKNQILYELILHKEFEHIYQNWYDVLSYVVEIDSEQIIPIINLLNQKKGGLVIDDYFRLLDYVDIKQLTTTQKAFIFETIFEYHQKNNIWIHYNIHRVIGFYEDSNYNLFFNVLIEIRGSNTVQLVNQIHFIENLIYLNKLNDSKLEFWENSLKHLLLECNNNTIQNACIYALININKIDVFIELKESLIGKSTELDNSFYRAISTIDSNSDFTFNQLIKGLQQDNNSARFGLQRITQYEKLFKLLNILIENETEYVNFLKDDGSLAFSYETFFLNIDSLLILKDDPIYDKIFNLFIKVLNDKVNYFQYQNKDFVRECFKFLYNKNDGLISDLLDILTESIFHYELTNVICKYIKYNSIDGLSNKLIEKYGDNKSLKDIYRRINETNNPEKELIYESRLKYFNEESTNIGNQPYIKEEEHKLSIYNKFRYELEPEPERFYLRVFETYLQYRDIIDSFIQDDEKKKFISIIINIIKNNNPIDSSVSIIDKGNNSRQINMNEFNIYFPRILKIAYIFNLKEDLEPYRSSIINYIPIMYDDISTNTIDDVELFQLIGELSENDIDYLFDNCLKSTDDYLHVATSSFIRLIKQKKYKKLIPIVKRLAIDVKCKAYEILEALDCLSVPEFEVEEIYFKNLFNNQVEDTKDNWNIKNRLSQILVSNFKEKEAIKWRLDYLKNNIIKYDEPEFGGVRFVPDWEIELDNPSFGNCLIETGDQTLAPYFLDLLKLSFEIRKEIIYWKYSNYIQTIVFGYYKYLNSPIYLNQLKDFVKENSMHGYADSFSNHIRNLEISIIESLKPLNINICINKYNDLKKAVLLPIYDESDLRYHFEKSINELKNVIENEGLYKTIQDLAKPKNNDKVKTCYSDMNEDIIQKTIKVQLENILLKKGFRGTDIHREVELYNGMRTDYLIKYGFIGPIMVEIKLLHNREITTKTKMIEYKEKLKQYISATNSQYSFYLVFEIREGEYYKKHKLSFEKMKDEYSDLNNLGIYLISCIK